MAKVYTIADLEVIRSDTGDGGWSIHRKDQPADDVEPLISGPAEWIEETVDSRGHWSRPNADDFAVAVENANKL